MRVKKEIKSFAEGCIRLLVTQRWGIYFINQLYNLLSYNGCSVFYFNFSKIFRESKQVIPESTWTLKFAGKRIAIPFSSDTFWLDWDTALSIKGHDLEIKRFYEKLIKSDTKPACFFDIGANYGTHSLLLLKHGVRTISFEPNPSCTFYFKNLLTENKLSGDIQPIALSEVSSGMAFLSFTERDTWLGSLKDLSSTDDKTISITVPVSNLDSYCSVSSIYPDLIKIDTEGYELEVLEGSIETIKKSKPIIIFESNTREQRNGIYDLFMKCAYYLHELEPSGNLSIEPISRRIFLNSARTNFVARTLAV